MMLSAPVSENKTKEQQGKAESEFEMEGDKRSGGWAGYGSLSPGSGRLAAVSQPMGKQAQQAVMQKAYGNQAMLRMMGRSPAQTPVTASPLSRGGILQRKCACGNAAGASGTCTTCQEKGGMALPGNIQTKLTINEPSDRYEQEADRVADQVMTASAHPAVSDAPPRIQRFTGQATGQADMAAPASVDRVLSSPGRPLEPGLQQDMEQRFGHDFSQVRVHTDAAAERSAQDVNANAYTVGQDIVFGAGRFAPVTNVGKRLITHELTHVIQQQQMGSLEVQRDELSEEEKRKAIQAKTQCESNLCHPSRRTDSFKGSSLFSDSPNLEALRQFALTSQKPPESPSSVEKKPEKGAHSSPPGLQPKPVSKKDSLTQGLEDLQNAQRNLGKPKSDQPRAIDTSPIMSPQEMAQLAQAMQAADQRAKLEVKQELTLADGTVISSTSPPPEKKFTIAPPKPGELTRDITFEGSVLAKANVEGEKARIIHNLDVELQRIEGITEICRGSAQQFLEQWPIMRRLADLTAGAEPPSMSIWFDVDTLIKQSQDAIKQGDLEKAIQLQEQANKALRNAQATWYRYKESNIGGAESIKTGAEYTRDGAKYSLMALATVASGGTALAVATGASVAIDVTEAATKAALGEKVDWGQVAVDVAIQIVLSKFGGKLSSGLMGALQKNPATQKVETQVLRGIVHSLINGVESRTISTYIRALYQNAFTQNKPITWSEFIDQLVTQITDPKSIVMDIILGAVAAKARTKAVGDAGASSKKPPPIENQLRGENELSPNNTATNRAPKLGDLPEQYKGQPPANDNAIHPDEPATMARTGTDDVDVSSSRPNLTVIQGGGAKGGQVVASAKGGKGSSSVATPQPSQQPLPSNLKIFKGVPLNLALKSNSKGTVLGDHLRFEQYRRSGGVLEYENWFVQSQDGIVKGGEVWGELSEELKLSMSTTAAPKGLTPQQTKQILAEAKAIDTAKSVAGNYREKFSKLHPDFPGGKEWQVHHSIPRKFRKTLRKAKINVDGPAFLRGVRTTPGELSNVHAKITTHWQNWHTDFVKSFGRQPTAAEIIEKAKEVDWLFGHLYWEAQKAAGIPVPTKDLGDGKML